MITRALVLVLVTAATTAHADPAPESTEYVAFGTTNTNIPVGLIVGGEVEAGHRLGDTPLWAHAAVAGGTVWSPNLFGPQGFGPFARARGGLEVRECGGWSKLCLFGGIDAGAQHARPEGMDAGPADAALVIPRVGLDVGRHQWRVRAAVQKSFASQASQREALFGASTVLAYQF